MIKDELKIERRPGMCCGTCANATLDYEDVAICSLDGEGGGSSDFCDHFVPRFGDSSC